ncbi:Phosphate-starvation-inducible E [Roseivivax halotolerans]|uniref:Phosphate-starvation-inducible E n=1 Tax=Roseivivax halotolerans TaxID=93684 RepID=A0A1I5X7Q6_9RHOB|nr:phosphate-starvation-inducible PsiE family protein [Roseivivax halotolerans]SFQ27856.1 Phosphate-starvation-inducible E [Roseivivax halotolerans]
MTEKIGKLFEHFATLVALALLVGVAAVIVIATASFLRLTAEVALQDSWQVSYTTLQQLFDLLLGAVIALELAHSVKLMVEGHRGYAQVRIVLVIGILAVVRKLIVIELETVSGFLLLGLAAAVIALGAIFGMLLWLDRTGDLPKD